MIGGAKRDRTADLNTASVALSQLSYSPIILRKSLIILDFYLNEINDELRILVTGGAGVNSLLRVSDNLPALHRDNQRRSRWRRSAGSLKSS